MFIGVAYPALGIVLKLFHLKISTLFSFIRPWAYLTGFLKEPHIYHFLLVSILLDPLCSTPC